MEDKSEQELLRGELEQMHVLLNGLVVVDRRAEGRTPTESKMGPDSGGVKRNESGQEVEPNSNSSVSCLVINCLYVHCT